MKAVERTQMLTFFNYFIKAVTVCLFILGCAKPNGGFAPGKEATIVDGTALNISPAVITLAVGNSVTFKATGGDGAYSYSIEFGAGSILSTTGSFTAPGVGGVATVRVTDGKGATADAIVTINNALQISPNNLSLAYNSASSFSATGGVSPYTFSLVSGGGSVDASSGIFSSASTTETVQLRVTDSKGNFSDSFINVYGALGISPTSYTLAINNTRAFTAAGGVPPYVFSIVSGGGSINAISGILTAPSTSGTVVVRATDSTGSVATSTVTVNDALQIAPAAQTISANANLTFFAQSGGVPPYTYSIVSGTGTINPSTGLYSAPNSAGSAVVRVMDSIGNTSDANVSVNAVLNVVPSTKTLAVNNSFTFSGSGGQSPYTFSVQSGSGSINASTGEFTASTASGITIVQITDSLGATSTANITVNPAILIAPASQSVVVTGIINFSVSGGVSPYTYSVQSGGGSVHASSGIYTAPTIAGTAVVRVTDSLGNFADSNITINNSLAVSPVTVTLAVNNNFSFTAMGGQSPYTFSIQSGGGTVNSTTGVYTAAGTSGSAVILLTDSSGATVTANVEVKPELTISQPTLTLAVNGTHTFAGAGGVAPYNFAIFSGGGSIVSEDGDFTAPATAGSVIVRITDSLGNIANSTVSVVSILEISPASKNLAVNNVSNFSPSGGQAPYTFSVVSGSGIINASTGSYSASASAGSATVRVTDNIGQTATANVIIHPALQISPATQTLAVNGNVNFSAAGGVSPYTYSVMSGGGVVDSSTGIYSAPTVAGNAVVRVTDSLGNTSNSNLTINNALGITPATITLAVNNAATFAAVGGTSPFSFSIVSGGGSINSSTGDYVASSSAGTAVVRITDALGDTVTASITVNSALAISPLTTTVAVNSLSSFSASGGVAPYSYSIVSGNGSIVANNGDFTAPASAGSVTVQVTDSLGNNSQSTITVVSILAISPTAKTLALNNSFTFTGSGGQIPYSYSIQSGSGNIDSSTGVFTAPVSSGSSVVKITDAIGQTAFSNVTINAALAISPSNKTVAISNTINYATTGGVSPYTYSVLSGGGTVVVATGSYTAPNVSGSAVVRVTDSLGNTSDSAVTINPALGISPTAVTLGINNSYTFAAVGGTAPFTFNIQSGAGSLNTSTGVFTAANVSGTTVVEVADALGATATATVTVNPGLAISPVTSTMAVNGTQTFTSSGGVSPFTFSVVSGGGLINSSTGVYNATSTAGSVIVRVTDSLNNTSNATITVISALAISPETKVLSVNNAFTFTGSGGQTPYTFAIQSGGGSINPSTGFYTAPASTGSAVVNVTDAIGQVAAANVTINAALVIAPATQIMAANTTQSFSGSGGVAPYTFSIVSGGGSINASTGLFTAPGTSGTTVIRVTDAASNTAHATVTVPSIVAINPSTKIMAMNSNFTFSGSGGQTPYAFAVQSGNGSINSVSGVYTSGSVAGNVSILITDALGQTATSAVTVVSSLAISPSSITVAVNNSRTFASVGGQSPYSYSIQSGGGVINSATGVYTAAGTAGSAVVLVTDAIGQNSTANVTVNAALAISPATVSIAVNGSQGFSASGGVSPYSFSIASGGGSINGSTGAFTAPAAAGSVTVRVTDSLGNTSNSSVTIANSLTISPATKIIAMSGTQTFAGAGGVPPYTYSIVSGGGAINASSGAFVAPAAQGTVTVRVTDSSLNTANATVTVVPPVTISPTTKVLAVNNSFTFTGGGGQSPYTFSIASGGGAIVAATGVYTASAAPGSTVVRVTDAIGQTATATVTVNAALSISPTTTTITLANTATFAVAGGVPTSTYTVFSGAGSVHATTGKFTPSAVGTAVVRATDTVGNTASGTVTVNPNLVLTPATDDVVVDGNLLFEPIGGVGPFTFEMVSGAGSVDVDSGDYSASAAPGTDVVRVTDSLGNTSQSTLTIYNSLTISPLTVTIPTSGTQTFTASGGLGARTFSIVSGGGSINPSTGVFTASPTAGETVVAVTDSIGNTNDATITVVSSLSITPQTLKLPVFSTATFSAILGTSPYTYSVTSGTGSIVATTGIYTGASTAGIGTVTVTGANLNTANATVTHIEPVKLESGTSHTCALYNEGSVKCWGAGTSGQLGHGATSSLGAAANQGGDKLPFVNLGTGRTATDLAAGTSHNCALLDNGSVKCWGLNSSGQLGLGNTTNRGGAANQMGDNLPAVNLGVGRTAVKVFAHGSSSCALLDNGGLKCWGLNTSGQLGLGDTTNRGTLASQMGDALPEINLGTSRTAAKVSGGSNFACALLNNATVKCWGNATYGQTGYQSTIARGVGPGEMGDALPTVNLGTARTAKNISAGTNHVCGILDNNTVKCWGRNNRGQLGYDNTTTKGAATGTMGDSLAAVNLNGLVPARMRLGNQWSCVVSTTGASKCWGFNTSGQLAIGNTLNQGDSAGEMAALGLINFGTSLTVSDISVGGAFACIITNTKRIKCFGSATGGALLNGSTTSHIGDTASELGNGMPFVNH